MIPYQPENMPPEIDWPTIVRKMGAAHDALSRYDGSLEGIPNSDLLLAPLATREAVLSSQIEGTQATPDDVYRFEAGQRDVTPRVRDDIAEIINYRKAAAAALRELESRPVTLRLILRIHRTLLQGVRGHSKMRGAFRIDQNWLGAPGCAIDEATYVPPLAIDLNRHMSGFEKFFHSDQPDKLVHAALVHAQLELLHPFKDGNGRVGRILIPLFLYTTKCISHPHFFISAYLERHRQEYYDHLLGISAKGDWTGWIDFFLRAITNQADENHDKVRDIITLYEEMKVNIVRTTRSQFSIKALDTLFTMPFFTTTLFAQNAGVSYQMAVRLLHLLKKQDIITQVIPGAGRRPTFFMFPALVAITQ